MLALGTSCGLGNIPADYAPPELRELGLHQAPLYVARTLMPDRGIGLLLAHPRLGQPAIRMAGETFEVSWIAPAFGGPAEISLSTGLALADGDGICDRDGICHLEMPAPAMPAGLYGLCIRLGNAEQCSPGALAIADAYADTATIVQISDSHVGDGHSLDVFARVIDAIDAIDPPPAFAIFTGDATNDGIEDQRADFIAQLSRLTVPVYAVTGNHDYDAFGIEGHLIDVGPELDIEAWYGGLHLVGVSSGQDLDDGDHNTTISESSGPDASQLAWLKTVFDRSSPTVAFFHHPIYNALFATLGPDSRDDVKSLVTRSNMRAVLAGHTHTTAVFDADGDSRGLSLDSGTVPSERWPLHYVAARTTNSNGGYAVLHVGATHVDYRWVELP